jgi:very-short-patch-repair endonuclease
MPITDDVPPLPKAKPELWAVLKVLGRQMRHAPTPAEDALWQRIRGRQLGMKFRSDPNRADDEQYIVNLVRRVVKVSVDTVRIVGGLPAAFE